MHQPFNPEFRQGEDQDFFRRMIDHGHVFIWCNEAVAYEVVPPIRWKRTFMLKRALLRGASESQKCRPAESVTLQNRLSLFQLTRSLCRLRSCWGIIGL